MLTGSNNPRNNNLNKKMGQSKPLLNYKLLCYSIGSLLLLEAACMLIPLAVAIGSAETHVIDWVDSIVITAGTAALLVLPFRKRHGEWGKREGYLVVASVWIWFSVFSAIALLICGATDNFTDAFFESMSGFTTTGASIMPNVEILPNSVLIWRSFMQWLGGMGIIVLSLVFGFGGMQIYIAEVSGPTKGKMSPRVRQTAIMLWGHYVVATVITFFMFAIGGMDIFDAVNHTFTTISTGGFSTKNDSLGYWNSPFIHWAAIGSMIFSSINYTVSYFFMPGKFRHALKDEEMRSMLFIFASLAIICSVANIANNPGDSLFTTITNSTFMSISAITGTGHSIDNFMLWPAGLWLVLLIAMCMGGSSGSTTGGIKIVRITMLVKNSYLEFRRLLHPRAIIPLKYNSKVITTETINGVMAFVFIFIGIMGLAAIIFSFLGLNPKDAIGMSVTSLANIGLGFGSLAEGNFYVLPDSVKWIMCFLMLIGRLELFTVLFLFTGAFWKR